MSENRVIYVFASIAALGFFYFFARDFIAAVVVLLSLIHISEPTRP